MKTIATIATISMKVIGEQGIMSISADRNGDTAGISFEVNGDKNELRKTWNELKKEIDRELK